MSRQIQFRRGTADEHATFTGAEGEITVDTTNKTIRVHDGTTPGGTMLARQSALDAIDYVIAWQTPTADNNYTWYRKYKSGWVEQGGLISNPNDQLNTTNLPITMQDDNYMYTDVFEDIFNYQTSSWRIVHCPNVLQSKTKTSFSRYVPDSTSRIRWCVRGLAE